MNREYGVDVDVEQGEGREKRKSVRIFAVGQYHDMTPFLRLTCPLDNVLVATVFNFPVDVVVCAAIHVTLFIGGLPAGVGAVTDAVITVVVGDKALGLEATAYVWVWAVPVTMSISSAIHALLFVWAGPCVVRRIGFVTDAAAAGDGVRLLGGAGIVAREFFVM